MSFESDSEPNPEAYTVGWIAPMPIELTAARTAFDVKFNNGHSLCLSGHNEYFGGRIGDFYVVMAVCAEIGTTHAQSLARNMCDVFPRIEFLLLVGIGGGVPKYGTDLQEEMVLGDVVVDRPGYGISGVFDYSRGAETKDGFIASSSVPAPPDLLLQAVGTLESNYSMDFYPKIIPRILENMRESINQDEPTEYEDPGPSKDFLFEDNYNHLDEKQSCEKCCDATKRRNRNPRGPKAARASNTPWIHYGLIGSANTLMISSKTRNSHRDSKRIICFEMEAIGVLHVKRGLVIRGISDYSDSHKNKAWQKYAAAAAAAYAKELLLNMSRGKECGTSEIWKALHENVPNSRKPEQVQAEPVEAQSPTVMVHSEASTETCLANSPTEEIANVVPPMCRDG